MDCARRHTGALIVGLLVLALAGPATAETISGAALVLEKDVVAGTVTLDAGIVLQVRESTRILNERGLPIPLSALPVARHVDGGYEESREATVRYQARLAGREKIAEEIRAGAVAPR